MRTESKRWLFESGSCSKRHLLWVFIEKKLCPIDSVQFLFNLARPRLCTRSPLRETGPSRCDVCPLACALCFGGWMRVQNSIHWLAGWLAGCVGWKAQKCQRRIRFLGSSHRSFPLGHSPPFTRFVSCGPVLHPPPSARSDWGAT
jgi:hypothetical protein